MPRARLVWLFALAGVACGARAQEHTAPRPTEGPCPAPPVRERVLACTTGPPPPRPPDDRALQEMEAEQFRTQTNLFKYARTAPGQSRWPRPLLETEERFLKVAHFARCNGVAEDNGPKPALTRESLEYKIGMVYYDASHWDEAAAILDLVAQSGSGDERSYAAQATILAMETLSSIGRTECGTEADRRAIRYREIFCQPVTTETKMLCASLEASAR